MSADRLDELAARLFQAGREERTSEAAERRTVNALRKQRNESSRRAATLPRRPPVLLLAAAAATALAAGGFLLTRGELKPIRISAERPASLPAAQPSSAAIPRVAEPTPSSEAPLTLHVRAARPTASLEQELASLQSARTLLSSGRADAALRELDRFDRVLGGTQLEAEASLLRMEALAAAGRQDEAAKLARRFLDQHSTDPLVDRARSYITQSSPAGGEEP